jgi:2-phosphosulfolactate phosphatase
MRSVDVCLSPDLINNYDLHSKLVVIVDILRATSCMTTGIACGVGSITPFESQDDCFAKKAEGYIVAGERGGKKIDGFDIGNSPFSYMEPQYKGADIAVTTTNGTRAIASASDADQIIIGSFLNLSAVVSYIKNQEKDVIVYCAGWKGRVSLEDTLFAGALCNQLDDFEPADDGVTIAVTQFLSSENDLLKTVSTSGHAKRLSKFNVIKDIAFCLEMDVYDVVPVIKNGTIINATA